MYFSRYVSLVCLLTNLFLSLSVHLRQGGLADASPGLVRMSPVVRSRADARIHVLLQVEPLIESLEPYKHPLNPPP
jgi:hypothetical protein